METTNWTKERRRTTLRLGAKRHTYTTHQELRRAFWRAHPHFMEQCLDAGIKSNPHNEHCATFRRAYVDYVDSLARNGEISEALADRVTA